MSNSDLTTKKLLSAVDLVEELDNKAAETISGGQNMQRVLLLPQAGGPININNNTSLPVYFDLDFGTRSQDVRIESGATRQFISDAQNGVIDFDSSFCQPGIQVQSDTLTPGNQYNFSLSSNGCELYLSDAGPIA